ncbi:hypothetical protein B296_00012662 [Ensete ventricosum]|uniref:Uncharacterized protein n=1 Tax=Ensete ventricosum TaxID=4639 RepID=A0A426ZZN5_ENSVE|nr:hypothetical protein B296_00012662 [Ensete ventricosum]
MDAYYRRSPNCRDWDFVEIVVLLAKGPIGRGISHVVIFFILSLGLILSLMPKVVGGSANDAASFEADAKQSASQEREGYGCRKDVLTAMYENNYGDEGGPNSDLCSKSDVSVDVDIDKVTWSPPSTIKSHRDATCLHEERVVDLIVTYPVLAWSPPPSYVDANGGGCRDVYSEVGGCLVVDLMGGSQPRLEVGIVEAPVVAIVVTRLASLCICVDGVKDNCVSAVIKRGTRVLAYALKRGEARPECLARFLGGTLQRGVA